MEYNEMITSDPKIMMGKPTLKGTRITVEYILEELKAGREIQDLLHAHPFLTKEQIQSAIPFSGRRKTSQSSTHKLDADKRKPFDQEFGKPLINSE